MIPVFRPTVSQDEIDAVTDVLKSGWWGLGPKTQELERRFAEYVGARHAVGLSSATAALHLALKILGVEGGEVITTPMTFVSTNHAILYNNATPVFADVEPDTLNLDVADVERKISPRTRAIVVVHYGGHPADLDEIHALAKPRGIAVVEDAAHAAGAQYKGRRIGALSDATCFSFHAVKNLATGDGGMLTVDRDELDSRLRKLRWLGISEDTWNRVEGPSKYSWYYDVEEVGFKCHLNDILAAIGLVQLQKLERSNARRREIAARYTAAFADLPWLETPVERPYVRSSYHNYVVKAPQRDDLMRHLQEDGIATGMHYFPNHLYPIYEQWCVPLPVVERAWQRLVTLPLYPDLTDSEVERIVQRVRSFGALLRPA